MIKKQSVVALALLLLIPLVSALGGMLFSLINPEIAAGHANYVRNFRYLSLLKTLVAMGSAGVAGILWLIVCLLVIRSKGRSAWWLLCAALGPFGFAMLAMLDDSAPAETDRYARFVRGLNGFVRFGYEICAFVIIWVLAYWSMVLKRNLMILVQSAITGMSRAQILDLQNASSGMWAFAELNEVMYLVILCYLIWPIAFNFVGGMGGQSPILSRTARKQQS